MTTVSDKSSQLQNTACAGTTHSDTQANSAATTSCSKRRIGHCDDRRYFLPIFPGGCDRPIYRPLPITTQPFPKPIYQPITPPPGRGFEGYPSVVEQLGQLIQHLISSLTAMLNKPQPAPAQPPVQSLAPSTPPAPPAEAPAPQAPAAPVAQAPSAPADEPKTDNRKVSDLGRTGEFIWKPESDKDGKLAIILPSKFTGKVKNVRIVNAEGKLLERGAYSGTGNPGKEGPREHFRFDKPGAKYKDGVFVEIVMEDKSVKRIQIKETSKRVER